MSTKSGEVHLDHRFQDRVARGNKLLWKDSDGNEVDYDFVLELGGTDEKLGTPVGFIESFWRRGSRHSKDKARDDSGKLLPMRRTYPTARFLGIFAAGDFTVPARELVRSREIDLFYVSKDNVVRAFRNHDLEMDYGDKSFEKEKKRIVSVFQRRFSEKAKRQVVQALTGIVGYATVRSYVDRIRSALCALPQEFRFVLRSDSEPAVFTSIAAASTFLENPTFPSENPSESYVYNVVFSDGTEFERGVSDLTELRRLHGQIKQLADHMNGLSVD